MKTSREQFQAAQAAGATVGHEWAGVKLTPAANIEWRLADPNRYDYVLSAQTYRAILATDAARWAGWGWWNVSDDVVNWFAFARVRA
jgi:hypothetical protein